MPAPQERISRSKRTVVHLFTLVRLPHRPSLPARPRGSICEMAIGLAGMIPPAITPDVHRVHHVLLAALLVLCPGMLRAQVSKHLPLYDAQDKVVYGKVRMADGSA